MELVVDSGRVTKSKQFIASELGGYGDPPRGVEM